MERSCFTSMRRGPRLLKATLILALSLVVLLVLVGNTSTPVSAATFGPRDAGTGTNVNGPGSIAWTNAGYIVADDSNYATAILTPSAVSEYLQGTDYGFTISPDATINGITVSVMRRSSSDYYGYSVEDSDLYLLKGGAIVGTDHAVTTDWPTSMAAASYGGAADLWGSTWTPADINAANFGVVLSARNQSGYGNRTAYVDYIRITITCTLPGTTTTVVSSVNPSTYGDSVTFTATVTRSSGTNTPSGTVDFQDGGVSIGTGTLTDIGGGAAEASLATSSLAAGTHDITAVYNGDSNFSGSTSSPLTQTVNPLAMTVTADAGQGKTYGDADPLLSFTHVPALVGSDTFSGDLSRAPGENVGTYAITQGTLTAGSDYVITFVSDNFVITSLAITVTADAKSKAYGDTDPALTYTFDPAPLPFGETFSGALSRTPGETVGAYAIEQGTLSLNGNYTLNYVGANLTVTTLAITVTADSQSKAYGDTDPALTYTFSPMPLPFGDTFSGALSRTAGEIVGTYAVEQGTLSLNSNYTLSYVGANLTVTPLVVTVTADSQSKVYGDADPGLTFTYGPDLVGSDIFSGALSRAAGENVGSYAIDQGSLSLSSNYTLSYLEAELTITPLAITVTADSQSKVYGDADPALTFTCVPALLNSDSFSGSLSRTGNGSVGTYAVTQGTLTAGSNYAITLVSDSFVITPRSMTITAGDLSKTFGATITFAGTEFTVVGLLNTDLVNGMTLTSAGVDATAAAGMYAIVPSAAAGTGLDNYNITYLNGKLTVNKASVTWSIDSSPKPSARGQSVAITATASDRRVTGTVTFKDGGTVLGNARLSNGVARYSTSGLSAGNHYVTVSYEGDANFTDGAPSVYVHWVNAPAGINWWPVVGIAAAVGAGGWFFWFVFFRRRRKGEEQEQT
jgi:hypothetical protein